MNGTTISENNFKTVGFNSVGCNTADIQDIKISDGGAGSIGWGTETFALWEGSPTVVEGSSYVYYDPSMDPSMEATDFYWGDDVGNKVNFSIAGGQGVVITCVDGGLVVTTSGQVPTEPVNFTAIAENNFSGNPFSAAIDIQDIAISDGGAGSIGWGTETFALWEGSPTVVEGSSYVYYDPSMDPSMEATDFYWGDDVGNKVSYAIPAGQGFVITCVDAGLSVTINPPYSL